MPNWLIPLICHAIFVAFMSMVKIVRGYDKRIYMVVHDYYEFKKIVVITDFEREFFHPSIYIYKKPK